MRFPLVCLLAAICCASLQAAEPFFKKNDVIALVGGEDMVVASEYGYLELLLVRALPDYHLRFRNLAWEGDTVFEQRRDLNFPTWEEQLDKVGATVVIAQFGQMESMALAAFASSHPPANQLRLGSAPHPGVRKPLSPEAQKAEDDFLDAYRKLVERVGAGKKRRVIVLTPAGRPADRTADLGLEDLEMKIGRLGDRTVFIGGRFSFNAAVPPPLRDGLHLSAIGHTRLAGYIASDLLTQFIFHGVPGPNTEVRAPRLVKLPAKGGALEDPAEETLRQLIIAKNKLWFDYWRPQNWAFLAGDRINQPSSRDWRDPSIRWFPPEREQFLPLIEAKEKEIDALAAKLAQP